MAEKLNIDKYLLYRDKPLVCNERFMIYGSMSEAAYADIAVVSDKTEKTESGSEVKVPDMMMVTIWSTDKSKTEPLRIQEFKSGMFQALDYAYEQIERFNKR